MEKKVTWPWKQAGNLRIDQLLLTVLSKLKNHLA